VAWAAEMQRVHHRLRAALDAARDAAESGDPYRADARDLLLHCWGFCIALSGHHRAEDDVLFPALVAQRPELADVVRQLRQDHSMIEHLLGAYQRALDEHAGPDDLLRHLDGIGAIMESHFAYEERQLLAVLARLELPGPASAGYGPLA